MWRAAHNDTEELLGGHVHSTSAEGPCRNFLGTILVVLGTIGILAGVLSSVIQTQQLHIAGPDPIKPNQAYHETEFGSVPHTLYVTGFACPDGFNEILNGQYSFQGKTGEGRAFYAQGDALLYYDPECGGEKEGRDDSFGSWFFHQPRPGHSFHPTRKGQLADGGCLGNAYLQMEEHPEKYNETTPYQDFSQPPGALPPAVDKWFVWCGDNYGWAVRTLHIGGYPTVLAVQGSWQFVKTAMPKEKIKLKHGKSKTTTEGGEWEVSGSSSVKLGGKVGFLDFEDVSAEASTEVGGRLQHMWETEVESTSKKTVEFELPEDKGSALWQWVLIAKGKETGFVKTEQYAFTASGTGKDRPKCFPGGSKDGYRYQECHDGWEIPRAPSDQAPFQSAQHH